LDAKGALADPLERKAAEIDLSAKLDSEALVQSNRAIVIQQGQILDYQGKVQRQQLDITQRGKLQGAIAEVGQTAPTTQGANIQNTLFNAAANKQGTQYYVDFASSLTNAAKRNPIELPRFNSPYDSRSNYNIPGAKEPTKLGVSTAPSNAGSLDLRAGIDIPRFRTEEYETYQRNNRSRYQEFVANPVNVQIGPTVAQVRQESQDRSRVTTNPESKPPTIINLQMTNDFKLNVANSTESKDAFVNNTLGAIEEVLRLVEAKNK
jgi:hypothetical protein